MLDLFMWLSYRCFFAKGKESIRIFGRPGWSATWLSIHDLGDPQRSRTRPDAIWVLVAGVAGLHRQ